MIASHIQREVTISKDGLWEILLTIVEPKENIQENLC